MNLSEYKKLYPNASSLIELANGMPAYNGCIVIKSGLLQFTKETACCWGGPFEGDFAVFDLQDYSKAVSHRPKDNGNLILEVWDKAKKIDGAKIERGFYHYKIVDLPEDKPSLEFPISLKFYGNDDTSYAKFYKDIPSALFELDLFEANQPLDFH